LDRWIHHRNGIRRWCRKPFDFDMIHRPKGASCRLLTRWSRRLLPRHAAVHLRSCRLPACSSDLLALSNTASTQQGLLCNRVRNREGRDSKRETEGKSESTHWLHQWKAGMASRETSPKYRFSPPGSNRVKTRAMSAFLFRFTRDIDQAKQEHRIKIRKIGKIITVDLIGKD
jgi:hypothetical protein